MLDLQRLNNCFAGQPCLVGIFGKEDVFVQVFLQLIDAKGVLGVIKGNNGALSVRSMLEIVMIAIYERSNEKFEERVNEGW